MVNNNLSKIKSCQVVASINEDIGGPAYSVSSLANSLCNQSIDSSLFTLDYKDLGRQITSEKVHLYSPIATFTARHLRGYQPSAKLTLQKLAKDTVDLIHNHGLWMFQNIYARQVAEKNKLPLIISPRGMLEHWSLNNGKLKKQIAWLLYEKRNLDFSTAFHATSYEELLSIRKLGFKQPVAVIPNGVHLPDLQIKPSRLILEKQYPVLRGKYWLLFLSRIHPKKGLSNLLNAWSKLSKKSKDWHLIIAGSDLNGYQAELKKMTDAFGLSQSVTFTGMLSGTNKICALANSELFILPSYSENFGIAIAEALSYQIPVITTTGTPWKDVEEYRCGYRISPNTQEIERTLAEALNLSKYERKKMGIRGQELIKEKYSWNIVSKNMASVYKWILYGGDVPNCIFF